MSAPNKADSARPLAAPKPAEPGKPEAAAAKPLASTPELTAPAAAASKTPAKAPVKVPTALVTPTAATGVESQTTSVPTGAPLVKAAAPSPMAATGAASQTTSVPTGAPPTKPPPAKAPVAKAAPKADEPPTASPEEAVPKSGKVAALLASVAGAAASALSGASKTAVAPKDVPRTSAAAIVDPKAPVMSKERLMATGSVLATGVGAEAQVPKAKAKAKAGSQTAVVAPARSPVPLATATGDLAKPPVSASSPPVPSSVLHMVSCIPQPATALASAEETQWRMPSNGKMTGKPTEPCPTDANAPGPTIAAYATSAGPVITAPTPTADPSLGPARAYAKCAGPAIAALTGSTDSNGRTLEVPKEGPAAVAVGRAVAAGVVSAAAVVNGKPCAPIHKKLQIVFVTSELAPYSKTGGLGEAMDGLSVALAALGHRVMVISPRYDQYADAWDTSFWSSVTMGGKEESVHFFHAYKQKVDQVFVDHPTFSERVDGTTGSKLYGPDWGKDFSDNQARFAYFSKAALVAIQELPVGGYTYGDQCVVVANDWHSALVPLFIHEEKSRNCSKWKDTVTTFLCHNAVFQGRFALDKDLAAVLDIPQQYVDSITFQQPINVGRYNKKQMIVNTMAAGLRYVDRVMTVSPSYAQECAIDPEKGCELEELFALGRVTGIINGVKEGVSPGDAAFATKTKMCCGPFTAATADAAKNELKAAYRQENGLPASDGPLMCFIGRLDAQKGYDLLLEALMDVLEDTELQVVVVGAGRADLVQQTQAVEKKYPSKFFYAGWMGPERYALLAACDFALLPSRWEPCGLVQMEAMRMGTLPIVAPTGGLKDTIEDGVNGIWTDDTMTVEAVIDEDSSASIVRALRRAVGIHALPAKESAMKNAAMATAAEFTWSNAAMQYEAVFHELGVKDVAPLCGEEGPISVTLEKDDQVC